jgi:hypothetical protein
MMLDRREREEGSGLGGGRCTKEVERALVAFSFVGNYYVLLSLGVLYIVGRGCNLPPTQAS